jgi:hypothetical protein
MLSDAALSFSTTKALSAISSLSCFTASTAHSRTAGWSARHSSTSSG